MSNNRSLHDDYVYTYEIEKKEEEFYPSKTCSNPKKYNNIN